MSARVLSKAVVTFQLALGGLVVGAIIGISAGVLSARRAGSKLDTAINVVAATVIAIPPFYAALVLAVIFSVWLQIIPFGGYVPFSDNPFQWFVRMVLPWFAIGIPGAASLSRQTRSAVLKGLDAHHVQASRALARLCTKSSTSTRPRPENFVCGDFVPCLLKGKMIPPKSPPSRYWLLHRMRDCGSRCSLNSSRLMT